jgi:hypothetical protein
MNLVDICLCILAKQQVRRSVHHNVSELIAAIEHYIDATAIARTIISTRSRPVPR